MPNSFELQFTSLLPCYKIFQQLQIITKYEGTHLNELKALIRSDPYLALQYIHFIKSKTLCSRIEPFLSGAYTGRVYRFFDIFVLNLLTKSLNIKILQSLDSIWLQALSIACLAEAIYPIFELNASEGYLSGLLMLISHFDENAIQNYTTALKHVKTISPRSEIPLTSLQLAQKAYFSEKIYLPLQKPALVETIDNSYHLRYSIIQLAFVLKNTLISGNLPLEVSENELWLKLCKINVNLNSTYPMIIKKAYKRFKAIQNYIHFL